MWNRVGEGRSLHELAVVPRDALVQKCVIRIEQLEDAAILLDDALEKEFGFAAGRARLPSSANVRVSTARGNREIVPKTGERKRAGNPPTLMTSRSKPFPC